jgi:RNA polymerase sigma factor (sigma-70 family)
MPSEDARVKSIGESQRRFETTHWSIVLAAARNSSPAARVALARLCESYWYPLYAHIRYRGYTADLAQDLIQEFFSQLLEKGLLNTADPDRGRFRSFLMATLDHFLSKENRRLGAQKRGGNRRLLSLDFQGGEGRYNLEPAHQLTPERIYERRWALTLIDLVLAKLRDQQAADGKLTLFEHLKPYLTREVQPVRYEQIAKDLEMTAGALKVAVHRLRRRCRDMLRTEIARTVGDAEDIEDEIHDLFQAFAQ